MRAATKPPSGLSPAPPGKWVSRSSSRSRSESESAHEPNFLRIKPRASYRWGLGDFYLDLNATDPPGDEVVDGRHENPENKSHDAVDNWHKNPEAEHHCGYQSWRSCRGALSLLGVLGKCSGETS